ncbi:MAG: hypothetical protein P8Y67_01000 [Alphaproteobacteria bacterium]
MKFTLKLVAAATFALVAFAPSANAGGIFDDDGYHYRSLGHYCKYHHYTDRCKRYRRRMRHRRYHRQHVRKRYNSRCVSSRVHSVGRKWIPRGMARRSAIKAWKREVTVEFGSQYANWGKARGKSISCGPSGTGLGKLCEAKGRPCR